MKKRLLSLLLTLVMLVSMLPAMSLTAAAAAAEWASSGEYRKPNTVTGTGTSDDPYIISSGSDLTALAAAVNAGNVPGTGFGSNGTAGIYFKLSDGFTNTDKPLKTPIGQSSAAFTGVFDGNGRTVTLGIDRTEANAGMFGYVGSNGVIKNVITAGTVKNTDSYTGGVCGITNADASIINCQNKAEVNGKNYVGGVCGQNNSTILNCGNTGTVTGTAANVGGVCGHNNNNGTIQNCYNTGTVSSTNSYVGGVCGRVVSGTITNCYNAGSVSSTVTGGAAATVMADFGAISGTMKNCFYQSGSAANGKSSSLTEGAMKASSGDDALVTKLNKYITDNSETNFMKWAEKSGVNNDYPYLPTPSITVVLKSPNPVYGTAKSAYELFIVTPKDFASTPTLQVQWKHVSEEGAVTWNTTSPETTLSLTNDGKVTTTDKTPAGSYIFRITDGAGTSSVATTLTVDKASQTAPAAGTGYTVNYADEKITPATGYEVSTGTGGNFNTNKLSGETAIDFSKTYYVRASEKDNYKASDATANTFSRPAAPGAAPTLGSNTDTTVTLTAVSGYQYSKDGTTWQDSSEFTGLTAGTAYNFYHRFKGTTEAFASEKSTALSVTTKTAAGSAPSIAAADATVTQNTITLPYRAIYEYSTDGTNWNGTYAFTDLTPATQYTYYVREKETDSAMPSQTATVKVYTAAATPAANEGYSIDFAAEKVTVSAGYEISKTADPFTKETLTDNKLAIAPQTTYYIRKAAVEGGAPASAATGFTTPVRPTAPESAPEFVSKTDTTVVVTAVAGQEYSINGTNWFTGTDNKVTFSGLTQNTGYSVITRVKAVTTAGSEAFASENSAALSVTTKTAAANAPSITAANATVTQNTVTLPYDASYEYTKGDDAWQSGDGKNVFSGLDPATQYTFKIRVKETETAMPSNEATVTVYTAAATPANVAATGTVSYTDETFTPNSGYEISKTDGTGFSAMALNSGKVTIEPNTTYYIRKAASGGVPASATVTLTIPARPATPGTPEFVSKTDTTVVVTAVAGQEYSINGTNWFTGTDNKVTFSGLTQNTGYSVITRVKATTTAFASENSTALSVTTKTSAANAPGITADNATITQNTVTLPYNETYEYKMGSGEWQSGEGTNIFSGLNSATQYTFKIRVKGTDDAMPSNEATLQVYTAAATPAANEGYSIDFAAEKVTVNTGYEISKTADPFTAEPLTDNKLTIEPNTTYYIRKAASGSIPASAATGFTTPARPATPGAAPTLVSKTDTAVVVTAVAGQEYSINGGTSWVSNAVNDQITFSGLTQNQEYSVITRVKATTTAFASENSAALSVTTKTSAANAPGITADNATITQDTVTLPYDASYEYKMDSGNWQSGEGKNVYTGLDPATQHTFKIRVQETETAMPSNEATLQVYTAAATPANAAATGTVSYTDETFTPNSGYEISKTDGTGFSAMALTNGKVTIEPNTTYYIRKAASGGVPASATVTLTIPARPATPGTPVFVSKTDNTIVITAVDGQEYSINGGTNWLTGTDNKVTFSGLTQNHQYNVITRVKAVTTAGSEAFASENSAALSVTTKTSAAPAPSITPIVTATTVTLTYDATYEYKTGDGEWQSGEGKNVFTGLTPETEFTYYVRAKGTDTAMPSQTATVTGYTAYAAPANVAAAGTVSYTDETFTPKTGYEISKTDAPNFAAMELTGGKATIEPNTTYYIRKAAFGGIPASEAIEFTTPERPAAVTGVTAQQETIAKKDDAYLRGVTEEMEYRIKVDGGAYGDWITGYGTSIGFVFDVKPNPITRYDVEVRTKATTTAFAGETTGFTFLPNTTDKLTVSFGDDAESQQLAYGAKVDKPADPTRTDYTFGGWYTDEACTQAWNFGTDTVTDNMTLYPKWIENAVQKAAISGKVTEGGTVVPDAIAELYLGTVKVAATVTGANGNYSFDNVENGTYNIVVTKADGGKTKTEMIMVNTAGNFEKDVILPDTAVSSVVEVQDAEIDNVKSDISKTVVGGLDEIAKDTNVSDGDKVTIKLTVEPKEDENTTAQQAIKTEAGNGKKVEFLDMSLWMQVNDNATDDIGDSNTQLLTIVIPFNFEGVDVSSVMILRKHGTGNAEKLAKNPASGQEGFTVDRQAGTITVYAMKFSNYALAYEEKSSGGGGGGSGSTTTYPVECETDSAKNGTFTVDKKNASAGSTVTITVVPGKGFTLETLTVLDKNGKEVEVKNLGNNKFSFKMPSSKVTVSATFMEDNTMLNFFVDVKATDYFYDAVLWAAENGITNGVDAVHFGPETPVTRGQVVTFLWRAAGKPVVNYYMNMSDVKSGEYYSEAVRWALSEGITKGTTDTTFSPDMVCTRGQIVTFLARFAGVKDADTESVFTDVPANEFFAAAVKWAKDNGVTSGVTETTFEPYTNCNRAQVVTFLYRWMVK